jgi:hypothetical protein
MNTADALGLLNAQIADLQAQAKKLKAGVIANGDTIEGSLYNATPVFSARDTVNWKAVAEKLEPSRQLVAAHTKHTTVVSVRVTARKACAA